MQIACLGGSAVAVRDAAGFSSCLWKPPCSFPLTPRLQLMQRFMEVPVLWQSHKTFWKFVEILLEHFSKVFLGKFFLETFGNYLQFFFGKFFRKNGLWGLWGGGGGGAQMGLVCFTAMSSNRACHHGLHCSRFHWLVPWVCSGLRHRGLLPAGM